jgi:hypothetical protein
MRQGTAPPPVPFGQLPQQVTVDEAGPRDGLAGLADHCGLRGRRAQ